MGEILTSDKNAIAVKQLYNKSEVNCATLEVAGEFLFLFYITILTGSFMVPAIYIYPPMLWDMVSWNPATRSGR